MAEEKQKYSLISLDTGEEPVETTEVEERAGVTTTTTQVIDGEETIRVSSAGRTAATVDAASLAEDLAEAADEQAPMREHDAYHGNEPVQEEAPTFTSDESEDEEPVPYRRMQSVIVLCLIVLIAVFLVYFNFFR